MWTAWEIVAFADGCAIDLANAGGVIDRPVDFDLRVVESESENPEKALQQVARVFVIP